MYVNVYSGMVGMVRNGSFYFRTGRANHAYTIDNTLALHRFYVLDQGCLTTKISPRRNLYGIVEGSFCV